MIAMLAGYSFSVGPITKYGTNLFNELQFSLHTHIFIERLSLKMKPISKII